MKILWKNVVWNLTIRYWYVLCYFFRGDFKSGWALYYYPHPKPYTIEQHEKRMKKFIEYFEFLENKK